MIDVARGFHQLSTVEVVAGSRGNQAVSIPVIRRDCSCRYVIYGEVSVVLIVLLMQEKQRQLDAIVGKRTQRRTNGLRYGAVYIVPPGKGVVDPAAIFLIAA